MQDCLQEFTQVLGEDESQKPVEERMLEEINLTLHSFKNGKTSGADGIPKDFYAAFWHQVGPDLLGVCREYLQKGHLGTGVQSGSS